MSSPLLSLRCPQITQIGLKTLCNLWVSLTVWLFAVATVAGQTSAPATSSGTISGRVVNENGQPLAYATVSLYAIGVLRQRFGASELSSNCMAQFLRDLCFADKPPRWRFSHYRPGKGRCDHGHCHDTNRRTGCRRDRTGQDDQ
jgi:hypothetical protein